MQNQPFFSRLQDGLAFIFGRNSKQAINGYFNNRTTLQLNQGKVWIDTSVPYELYNTIPQLRTPVDKLAAMFSNGVFKIQVKGSDELKPLPTDLEKLLQNPNLFQDQNTFLKQYLTQLIVYGNEFMYKNQPSRLMKFPSALMNISPAYIKPELTGKFFDQTELKGIVSKYTYCENGKEKPFEVEQILWTKIADLDNPIAGCSPLKAMKFPLSNTRLAYQYLNVISGEKGNIGILSTEPQKDSMGALPMSEEDKRELESLYRENNGIEDNQKKLQITTASVKWQPMTYPTKDLLLLEQIDANFLAILQVLGVNPNLYVNSTYENLRHGLVQTHNDTVMPYADSFTQSLSKFLGFKDNERLVLDYSHLPYLQEDEKEEADIFNIVSNALKTLVDGGIIDQVEANKRLENQFGFKA